MKRNLLFALLLIPFFVHGQMESNEKETISLTYKFNFEGGYTVGVGDNDIDRIDATTSHGVLMYGYLFFGIGTGVHYYHKSEESILPVFLDVKTDMLKTSNNIVPLIGLKVGYSFNASNDFDKVGKYIAPYLGVRFRNAKEQDIYLTAGYTAQWVNLDKYALDNINVEGITLKVGFSF